jgi:hypothetical protein
MATAKEQITEIASFTNVRQRLAQVQSLMESMRGSLIALKQRNTELETELSLVEADRDISLELLL